LILLDRSFELLLKAAILHKDGKIREPYAKETIGFDRRYSRWRFHEAAIRFAGHAELGPQAPAWSSTV
jgi:hypothetical protein